jgi:uncharacterized protein
MTAMKEAIMKEKDSFVLFGGEPLLVPERDLEELWSWGLKHFGKNGIQTNGSLINDVHIRLFKEYKVHVGISIDGPEELNDVRWGGTLEGTRRATQRTENAIEKLCKEGIHPSLIVTLHRDNAVGERLLRLSEWIKRLDDLKIKSVRLHILEVDNATTRERYTLTTEENIFTFLHLAKLEGQLKYIKFDVFQDIKRMLVGDDKKTTCVWNACDPYTTKAVRGIEGFGQRSNCGRTNKEGVDFVKSDVTGYERYIALYNTPQDRGGCQGCEFFLMCKGHCPGTSLESDWRNRTEHCLVWKALFKFFEEEINQSGYGRLLSRREKKVIEDIFVQSWKQGTNSSMSKLLPVVRQSIG